MRHTTHLSIIVFVLMFTGSAVAYSQAAENGNDLNSAVSTGAPQIVSSPNLAGYDGGVHVTDKNSRFHLLINGMVKTRFDLSGDEMVQKPEGMASDVTRTFHSSFNVPFARLMFSGHVFSNKLKYTLFYDFSKNKLIYAFWAWHFIPKKLVLKAGRFKRPFARAFLASSVRRQFIDTPLGMLGHGIDVGIELGNCYSNVNGFEWAIGVFNGSPGTSGDLSPNITARLGYNNGIKGYEETDFNGGGFRYGFGISGSTEFDHDNNNATVHYAGADVIVKAHGFSANGAVYLGGSAMDTIFDESRMRHVGGHIQAGIVIGHLVEPIVRYGFTHERHVKDDVQHAFTGGVTLHFIPNHHLKWENNFTIHNTPLPDSAPQNALVDMLFVSQLQLFF
ncbi:MAG: hypothetical protein JXR76_09150 [Deltaproteobacteria bacterium]|nr:hypothetical protein [Deltaproteobacteria bacterium]